MKILVHYPFTDEQHDHLRQIAHANGGHEVFVANDEQEALAVASEIDIIVGHFPPAVCAAAPNLRWVQSFSTGMDKFLFPEIIARDEVAISNVAGLYAPQGGEHAWALLLALTRGIDQSIRHNDQRKWAGGATVELTGQTLGLVGLGGFGLEMAKRAAGYDMPIIAIDPVRRDLPPAADWMIHALSEVTARLRRDDPVRYLTIEEEAELLDWDAEKYRQALARA